VRAGTPAASPRLRSRVAKLRERWFWQVVHRFYWHVAKFDGRVHGQGPLLVAIGDSITDPFVGFHFPRQVWLRVVGRRLGYKTVNLGNGSDNTADMRRRIEQFLSEGQPEIAVLFAGNVDAEVGIDPDETETNVRFIVEWLREHGVEKIVLIGPGMINLPRLPEYMPQVTDWFSSIAGVRAMLRDVAAEHDVVFVDLALSLRDRIARGDDPDFSRVPYRQSRSWHAVVGDGHFNAYGQRLIAEAFLAGTAHWRGEQATQRSLPEAQHGATSQRATELV
jgi:lysophospholipase L1-like esterase